jgi:glucan biosynthesis protein C
MATSVNWRTVSPVRPPLPPLSSPPPTREGRVDSLESARVQTMRGLACLLLVAFHTIGSTGASGLHVSDGSGYRGFANLFVHIRMPLFTFLSGLVYAYRPLRLEQTWQFSRKKLRRLGVPLIVATTVLYAMRLAMHQHVPPLTQAWSIFVFPYWHLWFVQALLIVFAALIALESLGALATFGRYLMVFGVSLALFLAAPFEQNAFGLQNATYLLPFFLCGVGAHRFRAVLQTRRALIATVACFVAAQGVHSYLVVTRLHAPIDPIANRSVLNLLIGMSAGLWALQRVPPMSLMERIGGASYPIYLYHPVFVAAAIAGAGAVFPLPRGILFVAAVAAGVAGPMALQRVARHVPHGGLLLEGK